MNILLTGSAGFIGANVAERLLKEDIKVVGIDNLNSYYDARLKRWRLISLEKNPGFDFYEIDIENYNNLDSLFKRYKFDAVINLAARAGVRYSIENPFIYFSTNVNGTLNLLELCKKFDIGKFILSSTSSLYAGQSVPYKEDLPVNYPISPYSASKKAAEAICYTYHHLYNLDVSIVRYFTVYGPAGRPDMSYFIFINKILNDEPIEVFGDGSQVRDFTYVTDIAEGTFLSLKKLGYEIINLGNNRPHKLDYLIELIEKNTGIKAKRQNLDFHKADMTETWANIEKAGKLLNWQPKVSLEEGIEKTVDWMIKNRSWMRALNL